MIKANKIAAFEFIFERYNQWLFRRRFDSIYLTGENHLPTGSDLPAIFCLNHSSWWDGLVAYFLSRRYKFDGFCMMEEKQLSKLRPFTWIGAFSVVRENAREAAASMRYAVEILTSGRNRALWIFPQGEILPNDIRPITIFGGVTKIAEKAAPCRIHPIAVRYEFLGNYKPSIFISIGAPFEVQSPKNADDLTAKLADTLTALLDALRDYIAGGHPHRFTEILHRRS